MKLTKELINKIIIPINSEGLDSEVHHCEYNIAVGRERIQKGFFELLYTENSPNKVFLNESTNP